MDEQTNKNGQGVVWTIIIIVILALVALGVYAKYAIKPEEATLPINTQSKTTSTDSEVQKQAPEDSVSSIEADLQAENSANLDNDTY